MPVKQDCKQVIVIRKYFNDKNGKIFQLRKGKIAAQASHVSMAFLLSGQDISHSMTIKLTDEQITWLTDPASAHAKIVLSCDFEKDLLEIFQQAKEKKLTVHKVIDAGRTEFDGIPTLTAIAIGPHESSKFKGLTDHLPLL